MVSGLYILFLHYQYCSDLFSSFIIVGATGILRKLHNEALNESRSYVSICRGKGTKKKRKASDKGGNAFDHYDRSCDVSAKAISVIIDDAYYYIYLVLNLMICESGAQVIMSRSADDSTNIIFEAIVEMERQALLIL